MSTLGRWLQPPPKGSLEQQYQEVVSLLRAKEKVLETTSHDLKVKTAAVQVLEQKIMSSETQFSAAQREFAARGEQLRVLEVELAARSNRVADLEAEGIAVRQQLSELNSTIAIQADELRAAQQAQDVLKEEIRVLREHNAQLNEGLVDRDQIRIRMEKLESAQDRVHQLEVELSNREATHREMIQQFERSLAERDRRISKFDVSTATQTDQLRAAQQASRDATQAQAVLKEEIRVLRDHIAQLNNDLADRDRLRAHLEKMESVQGRVHALEVELSDREAAHRGILQQLEQSITERDQRIGALDASVAAQAEKLSTAQQACRAAEQVQEVQKEENRVLRDQIAQLHEGLADRDQIRTRMEKLESAQDRVHQLEVELSNREAAHREILLQFERSLTERDQRIGAFDASAAAQMDQLRAAQQASQAATQAQEVLKEEIRVLRDHIAQLNNDLADRDQLRAQLKKLDSVQGRVHQLEIELSDREAGHRKMIQQFERSLAERDQRIGAFDASAAAQMDQLRAAQQASQAATQAQEVLKEEIRVLRDHIAQLNNDLADRDQLRAQLKKLDSVQGRVHQLEIELSDREAAHRGILQQLEQSITERDQRIGAFDASAAAQADELQAAQQACRTAEQAQEVLKEEIRVLREQIAHLNEGLADRDRLRTQVKKLESMQSRVHQLEVELSDREAAHRKALQQLEGTITERDRRIEKLAPAADLLREKGTELKEWDKKYARTVQEHQAELTKLQEQCAAQDQLREQLRLDEQRLQERDEQIASLHRELHALQAERHALVTEVQTVSGKDVQIERLQQRLRELRGTLRAKPAPTPEGARQARPNGAESGAQGGPPKGSKEPQKDDLKKIRGIGPVFADTLNKLGTHTFIQIARWKPEDIEKVAKKLETDPERIKRDKWIADAKKQHYRKYGERL